MTPSEVLLVGDVCVDFTVNKLGVEPKMRLGGLVHAARALWACGIPYSVAVACPSYLASRAEEYLQKHGCTSFFLLSDITGAPNVFIINDVQEVGHQGYEDILRDDRDFKIEDDISFLKNYRNIVVFPGSFDLGTFAQNLSDDAEVTLDFAYGIESMDELASFGSKLHFLATSTSSDLFLKTATSNVSTLLEAAAGLGVKALLLKENRGGSRLFDLEADEVHRIPAVLGPTTNSVGVGDAFTAVLSALKHDGLLDASLRGMQVATRYAQTTYPDDLRRNISRDFKLSVDVVRRLGGTSLTWHERPNFQIYLAAPDFSYVAKPEVDNAVAALEYHNFLVRRPVQENGEAKVGTAFSDLHHFYSQDVSILKDCSAVFAVPLDRDPGTLVEVGMAIAMDIPVVTFDPREENKNTMCICGSTIYSPDLDECLNGMFDILAKVRRQST
ncbi:MAG: nucleoside 2-deoxyribosyltransferase [Sulfitobacter sp.]|uniref:nucleoside 2-deoxyribosyltransferase n=1 Tax=Alphaproteobacteria TaxID=28211 RepID=UPI0029421BD5|nr:nucleoside 2-deoxyribosyltransferase [Sulfitobacter sp. LC.270.F.C4]WOI14870.1 nucleoside 2-deoxyribosyltransferase [Sulfitobacter sp. LC.270.F.C4]